MKKLIICIIALLPIIAFAAPISSKQAQQIAYEFINAPQVSQSGKRFSGVKKQMRIAKKEVLPNQNFYICQNPNGGGFVLVAADDVARPILGYSYTDQINFDEIPDNLRWWLTEYNREIEWAKENNIEQSEQAQREWEQLSQAVQGTEVVAPLVQVQWDQAPYYNDLCPKNIFATSTNKHTVTGCAATALAQVMKYWEWPIKGTGQHSYKTKYYGTQSADFGSTTYFWQFMPNQLTSSSSEYERFAVAQLMYHCGVALDMDYGIVDKYWESDKQKFFTGSGIADIQQVVDAVKNYFRYSNNTSSISKANYTETQWINLLKQQLDASIPMVYAGIGTGGGHAFVCDGYDSRNYFHFNWGWSGGCNEYYPVSALAPGPGGYGSGTTGDFTAQQFAVINMKPITVTGIEPNLQMASDWQLSSTSIPYGGAIAGSVSIRNNGGSSFVGDIIAVILDKDGNYFNEIVLQSNCTIGQGAPLTLTPSVSGIAALVPGKYSIRLDCKSASVGQQSIGSDTYVNNKEFEVYLSGNLETYSKFIVQNNSGNIVQNERTTIGVSVKNVTSNNYKGYFGLVLIDPFDLTYGQDVAEVDLTNTGIAAGAVQALSFTGRVSINAGTYLLVLMYKPQGGSYNFVGSTYYSNPTYVVVQEPISPVLEPGKYAIVTNRMTKADSTWYYLTSGITSTTLSKQRLYSKSTGTQIFNNIQEYNLPDSCIWQLEGDTTAWYLRNGNQYVTWKSGNTANLGSTAKALKMDILDNKKVLAHFNDGTNERYLSLNKTLNYFAFYASKDQAEELRFIPYREKDTITVRAKIPSTWGNTISAWTWGENNPGTWVTLIKEGDWVSYSSFGYESNLVLVNGTSWSTDNNQTMDINISCDACIVIGDEPTGKRSFTFVDCPNLITIKAKMPNNWSRTVSAWAWDESTSGEWVTLKREGDWYKYTRYCNQLNIVFVNGTTWSTDNNQTTDISTFVDACVEISDATEGKRTWLSVTCPEVEDRDTLVILARRSTTANWFYLTSKETSTSTKRLEAKDTGIKDLSQVPIDNLGDEYYWYIEETEDGIYLESNDKFVDWKSGNSAIMTDTGRVMIQGNGSSAEYHQFYFADNSATNRYLALNSNTANNYFAFYTGNDQKRDLLIIKKGGPDTPTNLITSTENNVMDKFLRDDRIYIQVQGILYDILGNKVR